MAGKILLINGTGGIGEELAHALSKEGMSLVIGFTNSESKASALCNKLSSQKLELNLEQPENFESVVEKLSTITDQLLGIVFLSSARPAILKFTEQNSYEMNRQFQVNAAGPALFTQVLIRKQLLKRPFGFVYGVLSKAMGLENTGVSSNMSAYIMGKYAQLGFLKSLHADYPWLKIDFSVPGFTETPMLEAFDPRYVELLKQKNAIEKPSVIAKEIADRILSYAKPH